MKLIIEDDEGHKTTVPFVREEITVGRAEGNTIRLTERNVSRRHARFFRQSGGVFVEDLKSHNGIRVNGDAIQGSVDLKDGDLIQIGDYDLAIQLEQQAAAKPNGASTPVDVVPVQNGVAATQVIQPGPGGATALINLPAMEVGTAEDVAADQAPRLVITNTDLAGREFACIRTVLTIGRGEECDIAIDHRSMSRSHCKIVRDDAGTWKVIDSGSPNKVRVNGEEYAESPLNSGDVVTLGHVKLRFVAPGEDFVYSPDLAQAEGSPPARKRSPIMFGVGGAAGLGVLTAVYFGVVRKPVPPQTMDNPVAVKPPPPPLIPTPPSPAPPPTATAPNPVGVAAVLPASVPASPPPSAVKPAEQASDGEIKIPDSAVTQAEAIPPRTHSGSSRSEGTSAKPGSRHEKGREVAEPKPEIKEKKVASAAAPEAAKKDTDDLRSQAEKSMADGDYDSAISKLRKVLKLDPNDALGHKLMGSCLASEGNLDEAAAHYRRFVSLAPNDPQAGEIKQILDSFEKNSNKP